MTIGKFQTTTQRLFGVRFSDYEIRVLHREFVLVVEWVLRKERFIAYITDDGVNCLVKKGLKLYPGSTLDPTANDVRALQVCINYWLKERGITSPQTMMYIEEEQLALMILTLCHELHQRAEQNEQAIS